MKETYDYDNDYIKEMYQTENSSLCQSCYSSRKGRAGCLTALCFVLGIYFIYIILSRIIPSDTVSLILAVFIVVIITCTHNKRKKAKTKNNNGSNNDSQ